ncbi:HEPN domain-containing protein [Acidianus manzaensis]|uniref:DNA-binding protein n=1 Tax=Acidianus manzaensis TaxID=282676 RepID=A0A1W6K324_9CREN|nr:HEPN domain-containing protein [Acidianus manzaensis]ARM76844.1 DNA-binding protein [Acidianus manzaensis]
MSRIKVQRQKRRALDFLADAKIDLSRGSYDIAIFNAEEALQLYLEAVIFELFGAEFRSHYVRALLSRLSQLLKNNNFEELSRRIDNISIEYRSLLISLEDSYTEINGDMDYDELQAKESIDIVEKIINELENISSSVKLGKG